MYEHEIRMTVGQLAVILMIAVTASLWLAYATGRGARVAQYDVRIGALLRRVRHLKAVVEELRHAAPDPEEGQGPDTTVDEPVEADVVVNRGRFAWHAVGAYLPDAPAPVVLAPAEVLRGQREVLSGERRGIWDAARELGLGTDWADRIDEIFGAPVLAVYDGPDIAEPFTSDAAIDVKLAEILRRGRWAELHAGDLTEALTRQRVGMPTGQYPVVAYRPVVPDREAALAGIRRIAAAGAR